MVPQMVTNGGYCVVRFKRSSVHRRSFRQGTRHRPSNELKPKKGSHPKLVLLQDRQQSTRFASSSSSLSGGLGHPNGILWFIRTRWSTRSQGGDVYSDSGRSRVQRRLDLRSLDSGIGTEARHLGDRCAAPASVAMLLEQREGSSECSALLMAQPLCVLTPPTPPRV